MNFCKKCRKICCYCFCYLLMAAIFLFVHTTIELLASKVSHIQKLVAEFPQNATAEIALNTTIYYDIQREVSETLYVSSFILCAICLSIVISILCMCNFGLLGCLASSSKMRINTEHVPVQRKNTGRTDTRQMNQEGKDQLTYSKSGIDTQQVPKSSEVSSSSQSHNALYPTLPSQPSSVVIRIE